MTSYQKLKAPEGMPPLPPSWLMRLMMALNVKASTPEPPFTKPDNWGELSPEQRRKLRFDHWVKGTGLEFASSQAKTVYQERAGLVRDALDLDRKPARVPVFAFVGVYALRRVGLTPKAMFYDQQNDAALAHVKFHTDLKPDASIFNFTWSGPALELLDYQVLRWPGDGLPTEQSYQYLEQEFMKGDEYPLLLGDPSDFMLRRVMPRMFKSLKGLEQLPKFAMGFYGDFSSYIAFGLPEVQEALKTLRKAAELTMLAMPAMMGMMVGPAVQGFPQFYGSALFAPFDALSDVLRSTRGVMLDIYRRPDDVIAACDMYASFMAENPILQMSSSPAVFIPLHKGADRFMSQEQFDTFYWPSLKKVMLDLVEDGFIPAPFAEGSYNHRLEAIADFPRNSCLWHFDQTDMQRASEVLGDVCSIMGNVPASLTATGTPEQMTAYCQDLIETVGASGNFILTNGCQVDEAKDENIQAMIGSVKEFGV